MHVFHVKICFINSYFEMLKNTFNKRLDNRLHSLVNQIVPQNNGLRGSKLK